MKKSRGSQNINWIEQYCVVPTGPNKSQRVKLTAAERATVLWVYDSPNGPRDDVPINDLTLAAYVALFCIWSASRRRCSRLSGPLRSTLMFLPLWAACPVPCCSSISNAEVSVCFAGH